MGNERAARLGGSFDVPDHRITEPLLAYEPKASVEIWSTRAGRQQRVKVYAGTHPDEIEQLIDQAVDAYDRLAGTDDSRPFRGPLR